MGNGDLGSANLLVRRLLDEISKLDGAIPEACKAMGVSPEDIARLANGQRVSLEALEAIRAWLDQRVVLSRPERDDYDRLRAAANQTLAVVLSNPAVGKSISAAMAKASRRELVAYAVAALAVVLLVGIIIGVVVARPGSAAAKADPGTPSSAAPPASTDDGTASPTPATSTSPAAGSSSSPSATAPATGGTQVVYQGVTLHIPALAPDESAGVTFAPPAGVTLNPGAGSDDDLDYFNMQDAYDNNTTPSWDLGSGDTLADIGTQSPSPASCNQLITTDPMDLSTQNFEQGQGYCIQIADGRIGYFRILSMAQGDGSGDSGAVILRLTLWQS